MSSNPSPTGPTSTVEAAALAELIDRIARFAPGEGVHETLVGPLKLIRVSKPTQCAPSIYEPRLCIVAQGSKVATLSDLTYRYDALNYLVVPVTLPMVGQVTEATEEKPYLCLRLDIDPQEIANLLADSHQPPASGVVDLGMYAARINPPLMDAVLRLMRLLETPQDLPVLAPMALREIFYRVLMGDLGHRLRALAVNDSRSSRIAKAVAMLREHYLQPLSIDDMAQSLHMSTSSFHHQFKAVTTMSPLQFQKQLRLHEARRLMRVNGLEAMVAAHKVGYESPSQFSREYRRLFGAPPRSEIGMARAVVEN